MKMQNILTLTSIFNDVKTQKLPLNVSFKIIKILEECEKATQLFQERFANILNEYGEIDENGELIMLPEGGYKLKEQYVEVCNIKVTELLESEVDLTQTSPFTLDELEPLELTFEQLRLLYQADLIKE